MDVGALREEASALRTRLGELSDLFADGTITAAQLTRGIERARARLAVVDTQMADAGRFPVLGELVSADDVEAAWDDLDLFGAGPRSTR